MADSMGVLVLSEGPADLVVAFDRELMNGALDTLLMHALLGSPPEGVVRVAFARCGSHAVIGLTSEGPGLSQLQLEQLYTTSTAGDSENPSSALASEALRTISTMLLEQGGYIDAECQPNGGMTLFIVVPASDEILEDPVKSGTMLAHGCTSPRQLEPVPGQKRSEKMIVHSDKFGAIEVDATDVLNFPTGIIGFPRESEFVLVRRGDSQVIGWLQSTQTTYLTLPVVSAHALAPRFPDVPIEVYAERAGIGSDPEELAVMAVLSAPPGQPATVNLMAPIIVNAATRIGAQILIENTRFSTRELFILPEPSSLDLERTATAMPNETQAATSAAE
jgi:flagellar assembly factor FliW